MSWFLKQKDILTSLHPDMSEKMVHKRVLRKCGGDLEHAIRRRFIEHCSTEDYLNSVEEITTRTTIGKNWHKPPIDNRTILKSISISNKPQDRTPFKFCKCEEDLIEIVFQYREAFSPVNEPLGAIKGPEMEIMLNLKRPYPPLLRRPVYPASPRARAELETHINDLMKMGALRKVGHNQEIEVTTLRIIINKGCLVILEH
ncbi:hypothetical protein O181_030411 [Austropuccinia psidii MF-1]|uniref:Uncharacterized protein n=1 Tax=Austropuccinia psidii MF-1 TaxID=1389203 RepID=A0A9Q3CSY2_9BASI|nr:hypothetical protein [Austropuccinia psidii MF-1]